MTLINHKPQEIAVLVGAGSIGLAIIRRIATAKKILIADLSQDNLDKVSETLLDAGFEVETRIVDASKRGDLKALAEYAASLGEVKYYVHTAGVSPNQGSSRLVLNVDLIGTAIAIDEFGKVMAPGGAGLVVSSQAGYMIPTLSSEQEFALTHTEPEKMAELDFLSEELVPTGGAAYGIAKKANQLYVQKASLEWAERGARINSISPGIIITPLGRHELNSEAAAGYQNMIQNSATGRTGTPDEVAAAAAFLMSDEASFITGSDLLIDGGVIAALKNGRIHF